LGSAKAEVDLEEGPRLVTHIAGADVKDFKYKMPVEVCFDDVTPEMTLPKFRPVLLHQAPASSLDTS
jgi:hypothetical protein